MYYLNAAELIEVAKAAIIKHVEKGGTVKEGWYGDLRIVNGTIELLGNCACPLTILSIENWKKDPPPPINSALLISGASLVYDLFLGRPINYFIMGFDKNIPYVLGVGEEEEFYQAGLQLRNWVETNHKKSFEKYEI